MTATSPPLAPQLPDPDSDVVAALVRGREAREAYRWLWENRADPQPLSGWLERSQAVFGKTNSNTGRRLRELYGEFEVHRFKQPGTGRWVYQLTGRRETPIDTSPITKRMEVEVTTLKGRFCQICGKSPREDGIKLQFDHIIPREWGGVTEIDNLEPLCAAHNHAKKAFFSTFDDVGPVIKTAMEQPDPWTRIGELLKGFFVLGRACPVELVFLVAKETHKGDPLKRLRELRFVLGWPIKASRKKDGEGITQVVYSLVAAAPPWPVQGASTAVLKYERDRKARKRKEGRDADAGQNERPGQH